MLATTLTCISWVIQQQFETLAERLHTRGNKGNPQFNSYCMTPWVTANHLTSFCGTVAKRISPVQGCILPNSDDRPSGLYGSTVACIYRLWRASAVTSRYGRLGPTAFGQVIKWRKLNQAQSHIPVLWQRREGRHWKVNWQPTSTAASNPMLSNNRD